LIIYSSRKRASSFFQLTVVDNTLQIYGDHNANLQKISRDIIKNILQPQLMIELALFLQKITTDDRTE